MVKRFTGSGREQEGGFLAVHKQDFRAHVTGGDWRHGAKDIDMEPIISALGGANVQETLEQLAAFISAQGSGFISIGKLDGYDGYATGSYNVGAPATPTLRDAFTAAFADSRLQNGGVILVLAGTYSLESTVEVPPGITIMGELAGSIIQSRTSEQSMFKVLAGTENTRIGGDSGSGPLRLEMGEPLDATTFFNLILADNLDGYVKTGSDPIATMQTVPMIDAEKSSHLVCDNVRFIGRINNGPVSGRAKTLRAIGGYSTGGGIGSKLSVKRCFFDGFETAIRFTPNLGNLDHLTIERCRARTFGTEGGSIALSDNCFVSMSICNATLLHNYFVGASTGGIGACFVVSSGAGNQDVTVQVIGNSGSPSAIDQVKSVYVDETGSIDLKAVVSGNNWASSMHSEWFITVGEGGALADSSFGDFVGSGAIDLVLNGSFEYPINVYVGEGTYDVTAVPGGSVTNRYNFIGVGWGSALPIFDFNLGAGAPTDEIGNRTFKCGRIVKGIHFRSAVGKTANFHSLRPGDVSSGARGSYVEDCIFENVTLSYNDGTLSTTAGNNIVIRNCKFKQTDDYNDNLSIFAPALEEVLIEGCDFSGNGYAGLIGEDTGLSYSTARNLNKIILRDTIMDLTGFTINESSPLTVGAYLVIDDDNAHIQLDNCNIVASNTLAARSDIITDGLAPIVSRYIYLKGRDVFVDSSLIQGPSETFTPGATEFPMPALEVNATQSIRLTNSRFKDGGMPVKIGGLNTTFSGNAEADGVYIDNCSFELPQSVARSTSALDIELDPTALTATDPIVSLTDSKFYLSPQNGVVPPQHQLITTNYDAQAIAQIWAPEFDTIVSGNSISGELHSTMPAGFDHFSGLLVNSIDGGNDLATINVSNNDINIVNQFSSGTAAESASAMWIKGTSININGNYIRTNNQASLNTSIISCLYIEATQTGGGLAPEPALVTNNTFSRRSDDGNSTSLNEGFVHIVGSSERGIVQSCSFSDDTTDGTDETVISDQSSSWIFLNNLNEIQTMVLRGGVGQLGFADAASGDMRAVIGGDSTGVDGDLESVLGWDSASSTIAVLFNYQDTAPEQALDMKWIIPLREIVPLGATLVEVSTTVDVTINPTAGQSKLRIVSSGGTDEDLSANPITTAGHTHSLVEGGTMTFTHKNFSSNYAYIEVFMDGLSHGSSVGYQVGEITVKYRL